MFSLIPAFISHRFCFISNHRSLLLHPFSFLRVCVFFMPLIFQSSLHLCSLPFIDVFTPMKSPHESLWLFLFAHLEKEV